MMTTKKEIKARMAEELQFGFNKEKISELDSKDDEVIRLSQPATIEDIMSKYNGVNVVLEENNTADKLTRMKQINP